MFINKIFSIIVTTFLFITLTACGSNSQAGEVGAQAEITDVPAGTESQEELDEEANTALPEVSQQTESESKTASTVTHSDVFVVYFSATGTTKGVAEKIAALTGGDMYEILAAQPYSEEDLNYNDADSRTTREQNDPNVRPEIGSEDVSFEGYKTIYLGYPIWHGQAPRIISTFVEKYSFSNITVIPFCTSGSSGIGQSAVSLEDQAGSGNWLAGERFDGNVSEDGLRTWIKEMK